MVDLKCVFSLQDVVTSVVFILCLFVGAVANAAYYSYDACTYNDAMCNDGVMKHIYNGLWITASLIPVDQAAVSFSVICNFTVQLCSGTVRCNVSCHAYLYL